MLHFLGQLKKKRNHMLETYHTMSIDLGFFGTKTPKPMQAIGLSAMDSNPCMVAVIVSTRYIYVEPIKDKSATSLIRALTVIFDKYFEKFKMYPLLLLSDQETALMGNRVAAFLEKHNCKLQTYIKSRKKSHFAEAAIRKLKQSLSKLKKNAVRRGMPTFSWIRVIQSVVDGYNARKLILWKKKMSFSPDDISPATFPAYLRKVRRKFPAYGLLGFAIDPSVVDWNIKIGSRVQLKRRAVEVPTIGSRLSGQSITEEVWIVKHRAVHTNIKRDLIKTLYLASEVDSSRTISVPETACVVIDEFY
jgi:hypothetical protein